MTTVDEAKKRLDDLTAQISTLTRTVSLGVLAVAWLFLSRSANITALANMAHQWQFLCIALLSILAVSFDLLQYVMGYKAVEVARDSAIKNGKNEFIYPNSCYRRLRFFFFRAKFWATIVAASWLILALAFPIANLVTK